MNGRSVLGDGDIPDVVGGVFDPPLAAAQFSECGRVGLVGADGGFEGVPVEAFEERPIVAFEGEWRRRSRRAARWPHSGSSSMLLAAETVAQAQTRKTTVRECHRPRRDRGSGTESRHGRRSAIRSALSGPSFAGTAGIGEDSAAGTSLFHDHWAEMPE
jgi:hypothetical protein